MYRFTPAEAALVDTLARLRDRMMDALEEERALADRLVLILRNQGAVEGVATLPIGNICVMRDVDLYRSAESVSVDGLPVETVYLQRIEG